MCDTRHIAKRWAMGRHVCSEEIGSIAASDPLNAVHRQNGQNNGVFRAGLGVSMAQMTGTFGKRDGWGIGSLLKQGSSFTDLIERVRSGDEQAASQPVQEFEPVVRRELRFRLRDRRARLELDSMDISQPVMGNFFLRAATRRFDLNEPGDLVKLLATMTRNKVAEKLREQHRQRRDTRRTILGASGSRSWIPTWLPVDSYHSNETYDRPIS